MSDKIDIYNLDADSEYFQFTLKGFTYQFRHLTTEEVKKLTSFKDDEKAIKEYLFGFISSTDPKAPDFKEATTHFILPQWRKFFNMLGVEWSPK